MFLCFYTPFTLFTSVTHAPTTTEFSPSFHSIPNDIYKRQIKTLSPLSSLLSALSFHGGPKRQQTHHQNKTKKKKKDQSPIAKKQLGFTEFIVLGIIKCHCRSTA
ncbi:hypothetical protein RIF29_25764 [Crotalaria pallida]|uniref:Uncharacterized protein n=1 Tax=Crotalaria pallida TaxID=3830 RepID=A0AAN9EM00_CROPI